MICRSCRVLMPAPTKSKRWASSSSSSRSSSPEVNRRSRDEAGSPSGHRARHARKERSLSLPRVDDANDEGPRKRRRGRRGGVKHRRRQGYATTLTAADASGTRTLEGHVSACVNKSGCRLCGETMAALMVKHLKEFHKVETEAAMQLMSAT